jgi:hypothetical protein
MPSDWWAQAVRPLMDTDPPQPVPPLPDLAEQATVEARVGAFGSMAVRERMEEWRTVVRDMIHKDFLISLEQDDRESGRASGVDFGQPWRELHEARPVEREARQLLADEIAGELGHRFRSVVPANTTETAETEPRSLPVTGAAVVAAAVGRDRQPNVAERRERRASKR